MLKATPLLSGKQEPIRRYGLHLIRSEPATQRLNSFNFAVVVFFLDQKALRKLSILNDIALSSCRVNENLKHSSVCHLQLPNLFLKFLKSK